MLTSKRVQCDDIEESIELAFFHCMDAYSLFKPVEVYLIQVKFLFFLLIFEAVRVRCLKIRNTIYFCVSSVQHKW